MNEELLMELADCGSPERLLSVILDHHPAWRPPVDIEAFGLTVGILEYRDLEVEGFVGALMTDIDKTKGVILSAAGLSVPRRRFTVGHELGHYLIGAHRGDKRCTSRDMLENRRETWHQKEEAQANRFAAGLLMPKPWFVAQMDELGSPDIRHLRAIASTYLVSIEAAANRYIELSCESCAFVFLRNGKVRYSRPSRSFPSLSIRPGDPAPSDCLVGANFEMAWSETDATDWLRTERQGRLPSVRMQRLDQADGFQTVLLLVDEVEEDQIDEEVSLEERYKPRFRY
ncbi:ImmA/IrrE family metallo-endopeptidase [Novosphingobium sp. JCM 18896]|uniref:ImmA/IrrE family metallo-endopeptidase n=1 Tax=Novosphingobium sp. JCM 18896 TaxID=2989731 RepID=UPI002221B509|nr:ImmA/IrrE family metallo-endopeptidase [Novosphingobium sp. JCM 18896]MCW1431345.1 ImmA/IrrE family metallo-endopeptidase [Novosphingobium sp. JCM 18896]